MAATAEAKNAPLPAKSGGSLKWALLILVCSGLAGVGAWYAAGRKSQAAPPAQAAAAQPQPAAVAATPTFIALDPAFVVNLAGGETQHFLQVDVQLITRDQAVADAVKKLEPDLRNRLVMLFSSQKPGDLVTREDKERLQTEALAEVKKGLAQFHAPTAVDSVIFTSFVMQ
ncbi:MAG TPA: flagellar basal body-associated FliL family protein [Burkholderiaceae bacterium]